MPENLINISLLSPSSPPFLLDKPECRKCAKALQELENIDDEADQLGIGFVKIHDETLADEYNLGELPRLVYYRHKTPIIYESMYTALCQEKLLCKRARNISFASFRIFVSFINFSCDVVKFKNDFNVSRALHR